MLHENRDGAIETLRERVLIALAVIANPGLLAVSSGLRTGQVGYQLCRLWFEDVYEPGIWTVDGLKGKRDAGRVEVFSAAFDDEERSYLERFNRFIELRLEMTPGELRRAQSIDPDRWAGIVRDAGNTLALIDPHFRVERHRIGHVLRLPK